MGKTYYAGVPGIHEQFGPAVSSMARKGLDSTRQHRQESPVAAFLIMFLLTLPVMPFWAGLMMLREGFFALRTFPNTPERAQAIFNIKFAAVFFVIGLFVFDFTIGRFI